MTKGTVPARGRANGCLAGIVVLATLFWSPNILAQNIYIDRPFPIFLRRPVVDLHMSYQVIDEEYVSRTRQNGLEKTTSVLALKASTDGYFYHPALVTFSAVLRPTFGRSTYESLGGGFGAESEGFGYEISTHWLREKPYAVTLSAAKSRTETNNSAQQPNFIDREAKSADMALPVSSLPSRLRYAETETATWGYYNFNEIDKYLQLTSEKHTENSRMNLLIERRRQGRGREGRISSFGERESASLTHEYKPWESARLGSSARIHKNSSDSFDYSGNQVSTRLELDHPFGFKSSWNFFAGEVQTALAESTSKGRSAALSHQLYQNLRTSLSLSDSTQINQNGSSQNLIQNLDLAYNRRIPWGHLNLGFSRARKFDDDRQTGDLEQILDEPYTFANTTTILLNNSNIDPSTIRVTDEIGLVEYQEGLDYWIESVGNTIIITRDPLAGIFDESTVLVSYIYVRTLPIDRQQDSRSYSASMRFGSWLMLALSDHLRYDSVDDPEPQFDLQSSRGRSYSATISFGRSRTQFDYREQANRDFSFVQRSVRQSLAKQLSPRLSMDFAAFWRESLLSNHPDWQTLYGLNVSAHLIVKRTNSLSLGYSLTRYESAFGNEDAYGLTVDYRWKYGAWRPRISVRLNEQLKEPEPFERTGKMLFFNIDRTFR